MTCEAAPQKPGPCSTCGEPVCGAKNQAGFACHARPGSRTDHPGVGRCYWHGGATPTGAPAGLTTKDAALRRYRMEKNPTLREVIERHRENPDPYSLDEELAVARALLEHRLERMYDRECPVCKRSADEDLSPGIIETISRVVARIEKIRSQDAISRAEFMAFVQKMALTVQYEVDEETMERIRARWQELTVAAP